MLGYHTEDLGFNPRYQKRKALFPQKRTINEFKENINKYVKKF
jgi:hypothetical protein